MVFPTSMMFLNLWSNRKYDIANRIIEPYFWYDIGSTILGVYHWASLSSETNVSLCVFDSHHVSWSK